MTPLSISLIQAGSAAWVHAAVVSGLILHIGAGSLAMASGAVALSVRKGARLHRVSGTLFFMSMLIMATMASALAVWIQQWNNVIGGVFAFYLVATAWVTVRRKEGTAGRFETAAMIVAFLGAAGILILGLQAVADPRTMPAGTPVQAYFLLAGIIGFAAAMDLRVVLRGGISGVQRLTRHVWRMCLAFFIAWLSFYGQIVLRNVPLPPFLHHSPLLYIPIVVPILLLAFWVIRVRFTDWFKGNPMAV